MITNFRRRISSSHPRPCEPGCDCDECTASRDELNDSAGCGPWMLLVVGFIAALTAIGISLIIIVTTVEEDRPQISQIHTDSNLRPSAKSADKKSGGSL